MTLNFSAHPWIRTVQELAGPITETREVEATLAEVSITAGKICLSRAEDTETGYIRNYAVLPGYLLAQWLAWNWWRLRWEPRRQVRKTDNSWSAAHHTATIGQGWIWPNITFNSDGIRMSVTARPSRPTVAEPLRYLADQTVILPATSLETGVERFVKEIIERLQECRMSATDLQILWDELTAERADPELAAYRKIEALLGCDPDEADPELVEMVLRDGLKLGEQAMVEVAASGEGPPLTAEQFGERCRQTGFAIRPEDGVRLALAEDLRPSVALPAWRVGVEVARRLRYAEHLDGTSVTDSRLTAMCAVDGAVLEQSGDGRMAFELDDDKKRGMVVLHSNWKTGRRFDLARLLGDRLLSEEDERLRPATAAHTYRQKMQRAFAAEFLCPIEALRDFLGDDFSDEAQENAAQHFEVSPRTVATLLANNGDIGREDLYDSDILTL